MKTKVVKSSSTPFVKGGNGKMAGKQNAGYAGKFAKGGNGKMAGKQTSKPAKGC
jgi:hypothetical protein